MFSYFLRLMIVISLVTPSIYAFSAQKIFITNGEWAPYMGKQLKEGGIVSHIITEAFAAVEIEVEYGYFPWKRSYRYAVNGVGESNRRWHATAAWYYAEKREKDLRYSDMVYEANEVMFYLKSNPVVWNSDSDLQGKRIGGTDYSPYPNLEPLRDKGIIKIIRSGEDDVQMQRLFFRNIDAVVVMKEVGLYYMAENLSNKDMSEVAYVEQSISKRHLYLLFSHKVEENQVLLEKFNRGLRIIRLSGRYSEIVKEFENGRYWSE
ncbi:transporter substrate-binding domain-containing protein [Vibrio sp. 99-8-1]|uniref:substrate-binding periplasmic protein n=1 Tax=Vibrio sp. 99-8-1 TaxID=2607602 RepID=UPI001493B455|nr:transporter substrate-binding domain-containing protein [Vibrio sp. 99-8-1]NOI66731.1 transporter substrate-binding domain-containing protein [Vibrio sp. 99-8-1]